MQLAPIGIVENGRHQEDPVVRWPGKHACTDAISQNVVTTLAHRSGRPPPCTCPVWPPPHHLPVQVAQCLPRALPHCLSHCLSHSSRSHSHQTVSLPRHTQLPSTLMPPPHCRGSPIAPRCRPPVNLAPTATVSDCLTGWCVSSSRLFLLPASSPTPFKPEKASSVADTSSPHTCHTCPHSTSGAPSCSTRYET